MKKTLLFLLALGVIQAQPALVQSTSAEGSAQSSLAKAFSSNNTAGNMIIAFVRMSTSSQTVSVADTLGNSYTDAVNQAQTTDGHQIHIFYAKNIAAGANTVTATFSASNNHPWLAIYEYSGLSTTAPLDKTAHSQGTDSSPTTGATSTTTTASELLFAGIGVPNNSSVTITAGTNFTLGQQDTNLSRAAVETRSVTSTGAYTGTFGVNSAQNWSAVIATFATPSAALSITTSSLPNGTVSTAYSSTLAATGGTTPYTWSLQSGTLPAGLSLAGSTGVISGTPTATGTSNFTVKVTDAVSATATKALSITINANTFNYTVTASNGDGSSCTVNKVAGSTPVLSWSCTSALSGLTQSLTTSAPANDQGSSTVGAGLGASGWPPDVNCTVGLNGTASSQTIAGLTVPANSAAISCTTDNRSSQPSGTVISTTTQPTQTVVWP